MEFIDSLSLAIPVANVNILDSELLTRYRMQRDSDSVIVASLDEEADHFIDDNPRINPMIEKPICAEKPEIGSIYFKIANTRVSQKEYEQCVVFSLNSKMLGEDYYQGITTQTARDLCHFVNSLGLIEVHYDSFLKGIVRDVDVARDYYDDIDLKSLSKAFKATAKADVRPWVTIHNQGSTGFTAGNRKVTKYPEFKVYAKEIDMTSPTGKKSDIAQKLAYTEHYLSDVQHPKARLEVSFPIKTDMERMGLLTKGQQNTLGQLLFNVHSGYGLMAISKRAQQYFHQVPFTEINDPKQLDPIEGERPPATVLAKLQSMIENADKLELTLDACIALSKIFMRRNHHKWARNYILKFHPVNTKQRADALHRVLGIKLSPVKLEEQITIDEFIENIDSNSSNEYVTIANGVDITRTEIEQLSDRNVLDAYKMYVNDKVHQSKRDNIELEYYSPAQYIEIFCIHWDNL